MKKETYAWIALMAAGLTACTQNDDLNGIAASDSAEISGSVMTEISSSSNAASTRFDGATGYWEADDAIGVYLTNSDNSSILNTAENIQFTLTTGAESTSGTFTNETGITYPDDDTSIIFHTYYPYSSSVGAYSSSVSSDCVYALDLADQSSGYKDYEIMYASASTTGAEVTSNGLSVTFAHKVAKATIYVTAPTDATVTSVAITGLPASASFYPVGGELTEGSDATAITPYCSTAEDSEDDYETYEAIILPVSDITDLGLKFTTSEGYTYVWEPSDDCEITKIEAGYEYCFNIGLGTAPSSSAGSSSDDDTTGSAGTLNEIKGETPGSYTASYFVTDQDGETLEIYSKAYDYDADAYIVDVQADDDLSSLLSATVSDGYNSVALRFTGDSDYSNAFGTISVPDDLTTLMLICDNPEQASITLSGLSNSANTVTNLYLYNLNITGGSNETGFTYKACIEGTISVDGCTMSNMHNVFHLSNNSVVAMEGITIKNSVFYGINTLIGELGSTTAITNGISITNTTVGKTSSDDNAGGLIGVGSLSEACYANLSDCTFECTADYCFLGGSSSRLYITLTNCIFAADGYGFFYWASLTDSSNNNNYAVKSSNSSFNNYTSYVTELDDWSSIFSSEQYSGNYYLSSSFVSSYDYSGDPRWYTESDSSSDSDE